MSTNFPQFGQNLDMSVRQDCWNNTQESSVSTGTQQTSQDKFSFGSLVTSPQNQNLKPSSFNDQEFNVESNFSLQGMFQNLLSKIQGNSKSQKQKDSSEQLPTQDVDSDEDSQQNTDKPDIASEKANVSSKSKSPSSKENFTDNMTSLAESIAKLEELNELLQNKKIFSIIS